MRAQPMQSPEECGEEGYGANHQLCSFISALQIGKIQARARHSTITSAVWCQHGLSVSNQCLQDSNLADQIGNTTFSW